MSAKQRHLDYWKKKKALVKTHIIGVNEIVFYSESFNFVVRLERSSLKEKDWYYQGKLLHDWSGHAFTNDESRDLKYFDFKKGDIVWLSKHRFHEVDSDFLQEHYEC